MNCAACGHTNPERARFCLECGTPFALRCAGCGVELPPTAKFCLECGGRVGAPQAAAPSEAPRGSTRKVVTIIFGDLVGSTALHERLDAEAVRQFMESYYAAMRGAVEAHGGRVTQVMGDGVKAVFGAPRVAEDDAIRAVRAAVEMQRAFRALADEQRERVGKTGLRVAVNTGEVVTDDDTEIIGDPVNVAARLQEQGKDGDVVIGGSTQRIVAALVTLDRLGSFALKGRSEQVEAYRVVSLDAPAGAKAAAFVGRDEELARLTAVYDTAVAKPAAALAVLLGSPGLGKSRLIDEFARRHAETATVLTASCEAAGGATFAPLAKALREFLGSDDGASGETQRAALEAALPGGGGGAADAERARIVTGIAALLAGSPASPEETFFVVRRLLAALATERPVVLVIDDLHWAEPLLLDLVEHLVQWGSGVPLLVLVGARPELREMRSSLATPGGLVADVLALAGLDAGAAMRLASGVIGAADLPAAIAAKVLATSEGNPLFVAELVRMLVQEGALRREGERWIVGANLASLEMPPTIHALLAARIERLRPEERVVLERAAVVGRHFSRSAVAELLPRDVGDLDARLEALRRSELIERDTGWFLGEPVLRFHHVLIRDAAYRGLLKNTRAELHGRFADWIETRAGASVDHDDTIGWHLEQAHQHLSELGPLDAHGRALGERAARRLAAAGRRALVRDDAPLAASLLGRALGCLPADVAERADLALDWCEALLSAGDVGQAAAAIDELGRLSAGSARLSAWHTCFAGQHTVLTAPQALHETANAVAAAARELATLGDSAGEARAHFVHALALGRLGKVGACEAALDLALAASRRAGDNRRSNAVLAIAPIAALWGPSPVTRASGRCLDVVRVLRITQGAPAVEAVALSCQGVLEALRGRTDAARRMVASSRKMVEELGITQRLLEADVFAARIELLEGNAPAAERTLRPAYEGQRDLGLDSDAAQTAALLARALLAQDRAAEAEALSHESEALAGDDLQAAIAWRGVRAEALAKRGEHTAAIALAEAAVAIAAATDALLDHADARLALAAALRAAGRTKEADAEERRATELWEAKGATLLAERARSDGAGVAPVAVPGTEPIAAPPAVERRVRPNAATAWRARFEAALAARDTSAIAATFHEVYEEIDHPTGSSYGRDASIASLQRLFRSRDPYYEFEPLATLGERLLLGRRRTGASGDTRGRYDVGAYENTRIELDEVDERGLSCRWEVFAADHFGEAIARLYERYAELLPEGPARASAAATARSVAALLTASTEQGFEASVAPTFEAVDHRLVGHESVPAEALQRGFAATSELEDERRFRIDDVLGLSSDALLRGTTHSGIVRASGGSFERTVWALTVFRADGRITRHETFDVGQEALVLARFDELTASTTQPHPVQRRVRPNAATENAARLDAAVAARDSDALLPLIGDEMIVVDHTTGISFDRQGGLSSYRGLINARDGKSLHEPLATLGDSLALCRLLVSASGMGRGRLDVGPYEKEEFHLVDADAQGRRQLGEVFGANHLADAVARLYARYAEGLPDGPSRTRAAATARSVAALLGPGDVDAWCAPLTPALEFTDHRTLGFPSLRGREAFREFLRASFETSDGQAFRIDDVLCLRPDAMLWRGALVGTVRSSGGAFEIQHLNLMVIDGDGLFERVEFFDTNREADALARFDELSAAAAPQPFANAATRALERGAAALETRDWERFAALFAADFRSYDRTAMAQLDSDREQWLAAFRQIVEMTSAPPTRQVLATRGDRLTLVRMLWQGAAGDIGLSEIDWLLIIEVDERGDHVAVISFDPGDLDGATAELDARFEAGEAAAHPAASAWVAGFRRAFASRDWAALAALHAPDQVAHNHRLVGWGTLRGPGAWVPTLQEYVALAPDVQQRVHHLRTCERGSLWHFTWHGTRDGGAFEAPMLLVVELDPNGRERQLDVWEPEQLDAALARFGALAAAAAPTPFANAASRASDRIIALWMNKDWEGFAQSMVDGFQLSDRRRTVQLELDRDATIAFSRSIGELATTRIVPELVATRGDRLALLRWRVEVAGGEVGPSEIQHLNLLELDERGALPRIVRWDDDALASAYAELDARWSAHASPEQAPAVLWIQNYAAALARRDWDAMAVLYAPAFVADDHRLVSWGTLHGPAGFLEALRAMVELAPDVQLRLDHARAARRGHLLNWVWVGTRDGGAFESPLVAVAELDAGGRALRTDVYDPHHLERALARFEALGANAPQGPLAALAKPNAASAWLGRFQAPFNARDWDAVRLLYAQHATYEDRQRFSRVSGGLDMMLSSVRERAEAGARLERFELLGTAGDRVAIQRMLWAGGGAEDRFEMELVAVHEVDEAGRLVASISFDLDDARAAQREAWASWFAVDPVAAAVVEPLSRVLDAWNAQDRVRLRAIYAHDLVAEDHRHAGIGRIEDVDAYLDSVAALWELAPDAQTEAGWRWLAQGRHGAITVFRRHGVLPGGGAFESEYLYLYTVARGLITRIEGFELDAADAALARFAELRPDPLRIPPNAASRALDQVWRLAASGDTNALRVQVTDDFCFDDRGRWALVRGGVEDWQRSLQFLVDEARGRIETRLVATAGDRLALYHVRWREATGGDRFEIEGLRLAELDAADRFRTFILFDLEQRAAAHADLFERWLRLEADGFAGATIEFFRAWNAHDPGRMRALLPADYVFHDHRRTGIGRIEGSAPYIDSLAALWELSPDVRLGVLYGVTQAPHGFVSAVHWFGTNNEGGEFEGLAIALLLIRGGRQVGAELFEIDDMDAALARFEELRPDPLRIPPNAATQLVDRVAEAVAARDWGALRALASDEFRYDDRTKRALVSGDVEVWIASATFLASESAGKEYELLGTLGDRICVDRVVWKGAPDGTYFELDRIRVVELDAAGGLCAFLLFDVEDRAAAFEEAEARFLAGEAAGVSGQAPVRAFVSAVCRHDWETLFELLAPDFVFDDHRTLGMGVLDRERWIASVRAQDDLTRDLAIEDLRTLAWNRHGRVTQRRIFGTNLEGGLFENVFANVMLCEGDRIRRIEVFDLDDAEQAVARFHELCATRSA